MLTLLVREDCELCDHLLEALHPWLAQHAPHLALTVRDIDADPELQRRYGWRVPLLQLDDATVCEGRFEPEELWRLLRAR